MVVRQGLKAFPIDQEIKTKKYEAQIMIDRKYLHLGSFVSEEEAAKAYDEAAVKYFGDFAKLNFKRD